MKKVIKIGAVVLDYPLYISSEFDVDDYLGERTVAIDGSSVLFVAPKGAMTKDVKIYSKTNGWVEEATKDALMATVGTTSVIVEFDDSSSGTYYYDHTKIPMEFTPLYDGCVWYNVNINLLKG